MFSHDTYSHIQHRMPQHVQSDDALSMSRLDMHTYLTLILSDKVSQFRSEVVAEITQILEIQISHASTKHAQTIGILERTHASIKTALKISTGERRSMWHKYVQIAVMNYNTTCQQHTGLRTVHGIPWTHTLQRFRPEVRHQAKMENYT